ncbi:MAG: GNAT family N-acetyltransferase [Sphingomonadaceae bacterium]|nr:GNAT family N-acetyltransferase [Sphingomonadaceae bacterium]
MGPTGTPNNDSPDIARQPPLEIEARLTDGRAVCLRTIRPSDEARIRDGIAEMSDRSRYLRFFSAFREPPESIVKQLSAVDGHDHIGWGAILLDGEDNPPIAAAHAIRDAEQSASGELAIAVLDNFQGLGIARMLIAAVLCDCRAEGICELEMQVLPENRAAAGLVQALGGERKVAIDSVDHYLLDVQATLARLANGKAPPGVATVLSALC